MEQRNWDDFRHLCEVKMAWAGDTYTADCLQPSLFVHVFSTYTDTSALLPTYQRILDLLGDSLQYRRSTSIIRDKKTAFGEFPERLKNPEEETAYCGFDDKYSDCTFTQDYYPDVAGGVGCAGINIRHHKFTPESWKDRVTEYWENLKSGEPNYGFALSYVNVRIPVEQFTEAKAFLDWVLSLEILHSPSLFSATAGYCIEPYHKDQGKKGLWKKLEKILVEHPGFEYEIADDEDELGRIYSETHHMIKPQISRINWLNALNEEALLFYPGGIEGLREESAKWPDLALHPLQNGFMVQAGQQPGIGDDGRAPEAYYDAGKLLSPYLNLLVRPMHEEDRPDWAFQFHTPEVLDKIKKREQARLGV